MKGSKYPIILDDVVLDFPFHNAGKTTIQKQFLSLFKRQNKKWFRALSGIDLKVKKGSVVGIIGDNEILSAKYTFKSNRWNLQT